jgi:hypothetical protein
VAGKKKGEKQTQGANVDQNPGDAASRTVDKVVLMIVAGRGGDRVRSACLESLDMTEAEADATISEARRRLTVAADTVHDEEVGKAVMRINDLYARCMLKQDYRGALDAQRELNRLLGLSAEGADGPGDSDLGAEVARALAHLAPLGLTKRKDAPLAELCRLAAARVMALEAGK